jgi:hypothetical protein
MKKKRSDSASSHTCSQLQFRHQKRREVSLLDSFCPTSQGCRHTERVWTIACDSQAKAGRSSSRGLNWKEEGKEREGKPVPVFSLAWDDIQPILPPSTSSRIHTFSTSQTLATSPPALTLGTGRRTSACRRPRPSFLDRTSFYPSTRL